MNSILDVSTCPFQLRVSYGDKGRPMFQSDELVIPSIFPGARSAVAIDGAVYVGFKNHVYIQNAFDICTTSDTFTRRMIDPYALHVTLSKHHRLADIEAYFGIYGEVFCIADHSSSKGRYAFVNFMRRDAALRALQDGGIHMVRGLKIKIRGKVLSAKEPIAPKPYSPSRLLHQET